MGNSIHFWLANRKYLDMRGTPTPNLQIHAECSNHLSYLGQTFAVPYIWILALAPGAGGGGNSLFTLAGSSTIFMGYFFSSTNTKTIFCGIKTTNSYRIRSFRPQFSAASGTPPSFFGPSTPPGSGSIDIFVVKLSFEMLTAHRQQHSLSTHERMFLWKCQSFRNTDKRTNLVDSRVITGPLWQIVWWQKDHFDIGKGDKMTTLEDSDKIPLW